MATCSICRETIAMGGDGLCPACAGLWDWFLGRFDDAAFRAPKEEYLTPERTFLEMGADSLDTVELILEAEEAFGVTIDGLDAERMQTVADYLRFIQRDARKGGDRKLADREPMWDRDLDG